MFALLVYLAFLMQKIIYSTQIVLNTSTLIIVYHVTLYAHALIIGQFSQCILIYLYFFMSLRKKIFRIKKVYIQKYFNFFTYTFLTKRGRGIWYEFMKCIEKKMKTFFWESVLRRNESMMSMDEIKQIILYVNEFVNLWDEWLIMTCFFYGYRIQLLVTLVSYTYSLLYWILLENLN